MKIKKIFLTSLLVSSIVENQAQSIDVPERVADVVVGIAALGCLYYFGSIFYPDALSFRNLEKPGEANPTKDLQAEISGSQDSAKEKNNVLQGQAVVRLPLTKSHSSGKESDLQVFADNYRLRESMNAAMNVPYI